MYGCTFRHARVRGVDERLGHAAEGRADGRRRTHARTGRLAAFKVPRKISGSRASMAWTFCSESALKDWISTCQSLTALSRRSYLSSSARSLVLHVVLGIGRLGLDVVVDGLAVALEDLLEGRDLLARPLGAEPLARAAGLDLGERLGVDGAGAVLGRTAHGAVQRLVVQHDEHAVARDLQVLLDVVRAELQGAVVGGEGVLRTGAGRARCPMFSWTAAACAGAARRGPAARGPMSSSWPRALTSAPRSM